MVAKKGRKASKASDRPVLKTKKPRKKKTLTKEDAVLQKKISKEGLVKKAPVPAGNIALKLVEDSSFKKKNKSQKKKLKKGKGNVELEGDVPGIICLTNLPHGFFEKQLMKYFSQFGEVRNVRLVRSTQSGRSCGYGYVEFAHSIVARIAAQTMHNYLTFGKIMKCRYLEYTKAKSDKIFGVKPFKEKNCPKVKSRSAAIAKLNAERTKEQVESRTRRVVCNMSSKLRKLESLGVKLDLNVDIGNLEIVKSTKKEEAEAVASEEKEEGGEKSRKVKKTKKRKAEAEASDQKKEESVKKIKKGKAGAGTPDLEEESVKITETVASEQQEESVKKTEKEKVEASEQKEESLEKAKEVKKTKKGKAEVIASSKDEESAPSDKQESVPAEEKEGNVPTNTVEESVPSNTVEESVPSNTVDESVSKTAEESVVFEADESDDEIVVKTPPFAKKKLVKITTSSPATRLTGPAKLESKLGKKTPTKKVLAVMALENTPKSGKRTTPRKKTPKASKLEQQQASVKKNTPKKKRMSVIGGEENIKVPKQKRRSL